MKTKKIYTIDSYITAAVKEMADINGKTESSCAEEALSEALFGYNSNVAYWLGIMYGERDKYSAKDIVARCYSLLADDWTGTMRCQQNSILLDFSIDRAVGADLDIDDDRKYHGTYDAGYLTSNLQEICGFYRRKTQQDGDEVEVEDENRGQFNSESSYDATIRTIEEMCSQYRENPHSISIVNVISLLKNIWPDVCKCTYPYKILYELTKIQDEESYRNDSRIRYEARMAFVQASKFWH